MWCEIPPPSIINSQEVFFSSLLLTLLQILLFHCSAGQEVITREKLGWIALPCQPLSVPLVYTCGSAHTLAIPSTRELLIGSARVYKLRYLYASIYISIPTEGGRERERDTENTCSCLVTVCAPIREFQVHCQGRACAEEGHTSSSQQFIHYNIIAMYCCCVCRWWLARGRDRKRERERDQARLWGSLCVGRFIPTAAEPVVWSSAKELHRLLLLLLLRPGNQQQPYTHRWPWCHYCSLLGLLLNSFPNPTSSESVHIREPTGDSDRSVLLLEIQV